MADGLIALGVLSGSVLSGSVLSGCGTSGQPSSDAATDARDAASEVLVFNEVAGTGGDFVELLNRGSADLDVSDFAIADSDGAGPRIVAATRFPSGTVVPGGGYLVVMMESNCPEGLMRCFRGESGLSQGNGETVYLLNPTNVVQVQIAYPANGAPAGRSWGRLPNGSGAFVVTARTVGSANSE